MARLFGGSICMMGVDDGRRGDGRKILMSPLNEETIRSIGFFRVFDRRQLTWTTADLDDDPTSLNYGKPEYYTVMPRLEGFDMSTPFKVHYSRVLRFIGEELPEEEALKRRGWGDSSLQAVYTRLRGFAGALKATEDILDEFIVGILTIKNLQDLIAGVS